MINKISSIDSFNFDNIFYLCENYTGSKKIFNFEELKEYNYYSQIFLKLYELLGNNFIKYNFLIYSKIAQKTKAPDSHLLEKVINKNTILFIISDETGTIPYELAQKVKIIFKVLIKKNSIENIHYFPLGFANGYQEKIIQINERKYNVFFIGQLGRSRIKFYKFISHKTYIPDNALLLFKKIIKKDFSDLFDNSFIQFTTNFGEGLNKREYNEFLSNSKIVICPYGAVTEETFRHYEAMRAGCVVITLKMPPVFPYENSPIIQLNSWSQLSSTIKNLLSNPNLMEDIHNKTLNWWKEKCSEESIAKYVYDKINEKQ